MPLGDNPNMLVTPNISPPYPAWDQNKNYFLGDVVNWAGQNWLLFFFADNATQVGNGYAPDLYPITLNPVPSSSPGIYVPVASPPVPANTNGACWLNLTLATPPAPVWSPFIQYSPGAVVMYPVESPGIYWRCVEAALGEVPQLPTFIPGSAPPRISPQFWEPLNGSSVPSQLPASGLPSVVVPVPPLATFTGVSPSGTSPVALTFDWTLTPGTAYTAFKLQLVNNTDPLDVYALVTLPGNTLTYTYPSVPPTENFTATIIPEFFLQTATSSVVSITAGNSTIPGPATVTATYDPNSRQTTITWAAVGGAVSYDIFFSSTNPTVADTYLASEPLTTYVDSATAIYAACGLGAIVTVSVNAYFGPGVSSQPTTAAPFPLGPSDPSWFLTATPINGQTNYTGVVTFSQPAPLNGATFYVNWEVYKGAAQYGNYTAPIPFTTLGTPTTFTNSLDSGLSFDTGETYTIIANIFPPQGDGSASVTFTV